MMPRQDIVYSVIDGVTMGCVVKDSFDHISDAFLPCGLPIRKEPKTLPHGISGDVLVTKNPVEAMLQTC